MLDALDSATEEQMYLRQEMLSYIKSVPPGTRIAILQLNTELKLVQGFSSNPEDLVQAVRGKRDYPELPPVLDDLNEHFLILRNATSQIVDFLRGVPGHKSVVWFYGSGILAAGELDRRMSGKALFDGDRTRFADEAGKTTAVLALNHVALFWDNIAAPPVNPKFPILLLDEDMRKMARAQGGDYYHDNDIKGQLQQIADRAWDYYTISYTPSNPVFDGKYRKLRVETTAAGAEPQYRKGYYAFDDSRQRAQHERAQAAQTTGSPDAVDSAIRVGAATPRDILFFAHVQPAATPTKIAKHTPLPQYNFLDASYRKGQYRNYTIHYTVQPSTLPFLRHVDRGAPGHLDFMAVLYNTDGKVVNSVVTKTTIHATPANIQDLAVSGVQMTQVIAVPAKGNYFLRVGIHDTLDDKLGILEVPIDDIKLNTAPDSAAITFQH